jgi:hypothetical protein
LRLARRMRSGSRFPAARLALTRAAVFAVPPEIDGLCPHSPRFLGIRHVLSTRFLI